MDDDVSIEERFAAQRSEDHDREAAREYERGKRDERIATHTADQDRHLAIINGSIAQGVKESQELKANLAALKKAFDEWVAVQKALAEKGVSTRTFVIGVLALLVPVLILVITLAVSGGA